MRQFFNAMFFLQCLGSGIRPESTPNFKGFVGAGKSRPFTLLMRFEPPEDIGGDPRIKHPSLATENIDPPSQFTGGHDHRHYEEFLWPVPGLRLHSRADRPDTRLPIMPAMTGFAGDGKKSAPNRKIG